MKKVIISGITGQDGSYMAEYLLKNTDHQILGGMRRTSQAIVSNLSGVVDNPRFKLVPMDLCDVNSITSLIQNEQPDYFINLGAQSFVADSWIQPALTLRTNTESLIYICEAVKSFAPKCKIYSAGCHDTETKVLTKDGLRAYKDVKIGDLVYSINPKTKDLEFKKILKIFEYDYNGKMYVFKRGGLCVTPNHSMLYKTSSGNLSTRVADDFIRLSDVKYPVSNPLRGKMLPEDTDLSSHIPTQKRKGNACYGTHITKINTLDLCYLIGLYIGDGSCRIIEKKRMFSVRWENRRRKSDGTYVKNDPNAPKNIESTYRCPQIVIDIPRTDDAFESLTRLLDRNNIKWSLHGKCDVTFHQWGLIPYMKECGTSALEKCVPRWIFDLDSKYQEKVLLGIMDSDGDKRNALSTISPQLQEDVVRLTINCGKMPTVGMRPPRCATLANGRVIRGNYPERYVRRLKENTGYQRGNFNQIDYNGKVWCIEVEDNHNFIVERCGKFTFSGNSSEQWGDVLYSPQDQKHPMRPRSIYGVSKCAASMVCKIYRESFNLFVLHGILTNHESPRRQAYFVTRKITIGLARIKSEILAGKIPNPVAMGTLDSRRDWSHSLDFMDGIWKMLNQPSPKEYILSSGETHSVRDFWSTACQYAKIDGYFKEGEKKEDEKFIITSVDGNRIMPEVTAMVIDPAFYRPAEVDLLLGDSSPARSELGWEPKVSFNGLVKEMVENDLRLLGVRS